jgi:hypothetical protein
VTADQKYPETIATIKLMTSALDASLAFATDVRLGLVEAQAFRYPEAVGRDVACADVFEHDCEIIVNDDSYVRSLA